MNNPSNIHLRHDQCKLYFSIVNSVIIHASKRYVKIANFAFLSEIWKRTKKEKHLSGYVSIILKIMLIIYQKYNIFDIFSKELQFIFKKLA